VTDEEWYDEEISPKLLELAEECGKRGLSFVSVVEYGDGRAHIRRLAQHAGLEMVMIDHCAKIAPNLDGFVIGLKKYCREKGIDTSASIVIRMIAS
jgi:hypothetical protein